jgi:hypothetical protein
VRREEEAQAGRAAGAEIVIFPGVRRERHAEPDARIPDGEKDPRRDWLELADELPTGSL